MAKQRRRSSSSVLMKSICGYQASSTERLIFLPELRPGQARAAADVDEGPPLCFLRLDAFLVVRISGHPAVRKSFVDAALPEAQHDQRPWRWVRIAAQPGRVGAADRHRHSILLPEDLYYTLRAVVAGNDSEARALLRRQAVADSSHALCDLRPAEFLGVSVVHAHGKSAQRPALCDRDDDDDSHQRVPCERQPVDTEHASLEHGPLALEPVCTHGHAQCEQHGVDRRGIVAARVREPKVEQRHGPHPSNGTPMSLAPGTPESGEPYRECYSVDGKPKLVGPETLAAPVFDVSRMDALQEMEGDEPMPRLPDQVG